jgi:chromosomal replication initiation ATPase DnaA
MTTKQQTHRQIQNLFSVLSDALMDLGLLKTIDILRKGKKHNLQESEIHLVSIAVADTFSIPISALFGKSRKYPRKYAFAIWIYICHMDLKFTLTDLSAYLHCHMSTISKAKMLMEKLANDSAFDQKIHEKLAQSRQKFLQLNNTTSL